VQGRFNQPYKSHLLSILISIIIIGLKPRYVLGGQFRLTDRDERAMRAVEDTVALEFAEIRQKAGLSPMGRMKHRREIRQEVCTAAVMDRPTQLLSGAVYKTRDPSSITPELEKVALYGKNLRPQHCRFTRFLIEAWPAKSPNPPGTYWIAVRLFMSSGCEFFDSYFTDSIEYRGWWKKGIASQCSNLK
jgi:hypothetical protein